MALYSAIMRGSLEGVEVGINGVEVEEVVARRGCKRKSWALEGVEGKRVGCRRCL